MIIKTLVAYMLLLALLVGCSRPTPPSVSIQEAARALIQAGADVNSRGKDGATPLITPAFLCRAEIVRALLDHGADKNAKNNAGATALDSVAGSFDEVKGFYDLLQAALGSVGLKLDYEQIKATRPKIANMLG